MSRLRVAFAGSPDFAVPSLCATAEHCEIISVITPPDRPAGRGRKLSAPAVKIKAQALGLEVWQPPKIREPSALDRIAQMELDLLVVVAYGQIFPQRLLDLPKHGCINVHGSLLPRWRGAAPIQRAVLAGDAQTGVCIMQLEAGCDTGPVFCSASMPIQEGQSSGDLFLALSTQGGELLGGFLRDFADRPSPQVQDESLAVHAAKLHKSEAPTDFADSTFMVARHISGMDPWPGATAEFQDQQGRVHLLKLFAPTTQGAPDHDPGLAPGSIVEWGKSHLWVACNDGVLGIGGLQAAGKRRMTPQDFRPGSPLLPGDRALPIA